MPQSIDRSEVVNAVLVRLEGLTGTRWVGINGFGAAGKSTLASELAAAVPGSVVIHIDDFARPSVPAWDRGRFVAQVVDPLLRGDPGHYQRWDWDTDTGMEWHDVTVGRVLIVEGVSSTDERLPVPWDVTVWIDTPYEVRLARALERDGEAMLPTWTKRWMPEEEAYATAQRPQERVDFLVSGH